MTEMNFQRPRSGEIWMCDLMNGDGSVQNGYRPVFVLSNNMNNTYGNTLNIIPITSKHKENLPIHVKLGMNEAYGLKTPSTMLVEQIMTVSIDHMDKCIGKICDRETLDHISRAMMVQFPVLSAS